MSWHSILVKVVDCGHKRMGHGDQQYSCRLRCKKWPRPLMGQKCVKKYMIQFILSLFLQYNTFYNVDCFKATYTRQDKSIKVAREHTIMHYLRVQGEILDTATVCMVFVTSLSGHPGSVVDALPLQWPEHALLSPESTLQHTGRPGSATSYLAPALASHLHTHTQMHELTLLWL